MSYQVSDYTSAIWAYSPRTLLAGLPATPSTPAQVWAAAIWAYSPRTLTSLPADFLSAVIAFFGASAAASSIPGGISTVLPGKTTPLPYVVFEEIGASVSWKSDTSKFRKTRVRFKVYADDGDVASAAGDVLEDAFKNQSLLFSNGGATKFLIGDRGHKDEKAAMSSGGRQGWYFLVEFETHIRRNG